MKEMIEMFRDVAAEKQQEMTTVNELGAQQGAEMEQTAEKGESVRPAETLRDKIEAVRERFEQSFMEKKDTEQDDEARKQFEQLKENGDTPFTGQLGADLKKVQELQKKVEQAQRQVENRTKYFKTCVRDNYNVTTAKNELESAQSQLKSLQRQLHDATL